MCDKSLLENGKWPVSLDEQKCFFASSMLAAIQRNAVFVSRQGDVDSIHSVMLVLASEGVARQVKPDGGQDFIKPLKDFDFGRSDACGSGCHAKSRIKRSAFGITLFSCLLQDGDLTVPDQVTCPEYRKLPIMASTIGGRVQRLPRTRLS